jgi:hypothetical protein
MVRIQEEGASGKLSNPSVSRSVPQSISRVSALIPSKSALLKSSERNDAPSKDGGILIFG